MNNNPNQSYGQGLNRLNTQGMNPQGQYGNTNAPLTQFYPAQNPAPGMPNSGYGNPNPMMGMSNPGYGNMNQMPGMNMPSIPGNLPMPGGNVPPYGQSPMNSQSGYGMPQYPNYPPSNNYYQPPPSQNSFMQPMGNPNIFLRNLLTRHSDMIFQKYDSNRSGFLDVKEIYPAVCELFGLCGIPNPSYSDVINIMRRFDNDGNGLIDMAEFRKIMLMMNGFQ